jgi:pyridoxamine 5'-phosphate oxidase
MNERGLPRFGGLHREDLDPDPMVQFGRWFDEVLRAGLNEPSAMTLATAGADGVPSARTVLLKGHDERGFMFFTNHESRKGSELATNPHAALVFYWNQLDRQVCVRGRVTRLTREESKAYWVTRPRGSRLGAWASRQSRILEDREALDERVRTLEERFGDDIPLPGFWGGYLVAPETIEFWQGRTDRLHDRFRYTRVAGAGWHLDRLYP